MKEDALTPTATQFPDIAAFSFETAMGELETIVRRLEKGDGSLESSLSDYARGTALRTHCAAMLSDAKMKVEMIVKQSNGAVTLAPFDTWTSPQMMI